MTTTTTTTTTRTITIKKQFILKCEHCHLIRLDLEEEERLCPRCWNGKLWIDLITMEEHKAVDDEA
jgi:hypothetical protein